MMKFNFFNSRVKTSMGFCDNFRDKTLYLNFDCHEVRQYISMGPKDKSCFFLNPIV